MDLTPLKERGVMESDRDRMSRIGLSYGEKHLGGAYASEKVLKGEEKE